MKALVKFGAGMNGVGLRDVPEPEPGKDEIKIKISAAGICGTDLHIMQDEYPHVEPVILGHEFVGAVVGTGTGVANFKKGDTVISLTAADTCGRCSYCRAGLYMLCSERKSIGSGLPGAMAEYMTIPAKIAFKVPAGVPYGEELVISEPLACCVRAVIERSSLRAGDFALVSGPGTVGLLCLQLAKLSGATVIAAGTGRDKERLELAKTLGADYVADDPEVLKALVESLCPQGVDVAYECAGAPPSAAACLNLLKKQGNYVQVALFGKTVPFDMDLALMKEITVQTTFAQEPASWEILLRLLSAGTLALSPLVQTKIPLEDWRRGISLFLNKEGYKIVLKP